MAKGSKTRAPRRADSKPAETVPRPERIPAWVKLILACGAVLALFAWARLSAPQPWSYDEYYHLGLAREMRSDFRMETFRWTPFSILYDHFVDGAPLFHVLLMPFATLPLERAGFFGVFLGQLFVVGVFAWALWTLKAPRPWWFVLALPALGPMFGLRMEMCRPQVWLIGFTVLVIALLVSRRWKTLGVVCALFGLTHTGGWIAIPLAVIWALSGLVSSPEGRGPEGRKIVWQPVAAAAGGWLLGQLMHPQVPANFRLFWISNFVIPFQATAGSNATLQSQLGTELAPPEAAVLVEQWPAFIAPLIVLALLIFQPRLRSRATLTVGLVSLAFLLAGSFAVRRFLELGAPLALLALALVLGERQERGLPPLMPAWGRVVAAVLILFGGIETFGALRAYGFGQVSQPREMAQWMGQHGAPGERVFTAQWADSSPLFYFAPQLQSLVALDPTVFYAKDPALFQTYVNIIRGNNPDPARTIRERFGARYVTLWKVPVFQQLAWQLGRAPGVGVAYSDNDYLVVDLGKNP